VENAVGLLGVLIVLMGLGCRCREWIAKNTTASRLKSVRR
jgi:hypothetical protein